MFEWVYCCYRVLTCSSWCSFDNIVNILKGSNVAVGFVVLVYVVSSAL